MAVVRGHTRSLNDVEDNDDTFLKVHGIMYKWTNFVYGWQKRYFELENGVLIYYKSESEKQYGSRGSIALHIARLVESDIDFSRFDVLTNDTCWYLRAQNPKSRNFWLRALKFQMSGSTIHPRNSYWADDVVKNTDCDHSPLSLEIISKMEQLERFNDMIGRQTARLEKLIHTIKDNRERTGATSLLDESIALNAVTIAVLQNINTCIHLLAKQTKVNRNHRYSGSNEMEHGIIANKNSERAIMNQTSEMSNVLNDDEQEWHDAYDGVSDNENNIENSKFLEKKETRISNAVLGNAIKESSEDYPGIADSPSKIVTLPESNPFAAEIRRITMEQLKYARSGVHDDVWQLFMEEDKMKMYKRELQIDGVVCDPLKAVHLVQGVSAREYIHYFFEPRYKHEWDETLVRTRVVDRISMDTVIIHQLHKRIWPSAQRESLFWSNVLYLPEEKSPDALDLYMVCNHDCKLPNVPLQHISNVRVDLTVAMLCETFVKDGHKKPIEKLERNDIQCQICYCAQVSPGGWVPVSALRVLYKREYPKFLRGFTKYVLNKIKAQPLTI